MLKKQGLSKTSLWFTGSCLPFYTRAVNKNLDDFQNDLNNLMSLHIHTPNIPHLIKKSKGKSIQTMCIFFLLNCIKLCNDLHKLLATQKRREAREEIIKPYQAIMQALPIRECKTRTDASSLSLKVNQLPSSQEQRSRASKYKGSRLLYLDASFVSFLIPHSLSRKNGCAYEWN